MKGVNNMENEKFMVYNSYTGEVMLDNASFEECEKYCGKVAHEENYGLMRHWEQGGKKYYDCGPRVFIIDRDFCGSKVI